MKKGFLSEPIVSVSELSQNLMETGAMGSVRQAGAVALQL